MTWMNSSTAVPLLHQAHQLLVKALAGWAAMLYCCCTESCCVINRCCCCRQYDAMSAYELFRQAGISKKLYDQFLAPMLLVTLFAPPTELSAAAALGESPLLPQLSSGKTTCCCCCCCLLLGCWLPTPAVSLLHRDFSFACGTQ